MCAPYLEKSKPTFLPWFLKRSSVRLQVYQILIDFNNFCTTETGKMDKTGHAFSYLLLKESVANDIINVLLFAGPVCCEPRRRQVEASSVGFCRC